MLGFSLALGVANLWLLIRLSGGRACRMTTVTFDTLALTERLKAAGLAAEQAEAIVRAIVESHGEIATKTDLRELEHRIITKLYQALLVQTFAIAGLVAALVKLL